MMRAWPAVIDEYATVEKLHEGYSIARFGDGEAALMHGKGQVREEPNRHLKDELRRVFSTPHPDCLVAIPTMHPKGAKYQNWMKRQGRFLSLLDAERAYYSAFISRPDSAQWIRSATYCLRLEHLWAGKRRAVVCEKDVAIFRLMRKAPGEMVHVECPHTHTYAQLDVIQRHIEAVNPDIALLSCGPAATCLANRLAGVGIQAIDVGSMGKFMMDELYEPIACK